MIYILLYCIFYIVLRLTHSSPAIKRMKPSEAKKMKKRYLNAIEDASKLQPTSSLASTTSGISNYGNTHTLPSSSSAVGRPLAQGDELLQLHPPHHNPTVSSSSSTNNTTTDCNKVSNYNQYDFDKHDSFDQSDNDGEEVDDEALFDRLINYHFIASKNQRSSGQYGDVDDGEGHNSDHEELTEEGDGDDGTLRSGDQEIEVIDLTSDAGTIRTLSSGGSGGSKMSKRSNSDTLVDSIADRVSLSAGKSEGDVHKRQKTHHHEDEQKQDQEQGPNDDYGNTYEPMLSDERDVNIDVAAGATCASATQATVPTAAASDLIVPITTLQRDESTASKRALNGNTKPDSGYTSASSTPSLAHNGNGNGSTAHKHSSHTSKVPKPKAIFDTDSLLSIPLPVIIQVHVKRSDIPCHLGGYMTSFKPHVYNTQLLLCLQHLQLLQSFYTNSNNSNNNISTTSQECHNIIKLTRILQNIEKSKQLAEVANIPPTNISGFVPPPTDADVYGVGILQHSGLIYGNTTTATTNKNTNTYNSSNTNSCNSKHYGEKFITINNIELYNKNIKYLERTFHMQCIQLLDSTTTATNGATIASTTDTSATMASHAPSVSTPITAASMQVSEPYLTIELIRLPEYVYDDVDSNPIHALIKQLVSTYHASNTNMTDTVVAVSSLSSSSNGTSNLHPVKSTPPIVTPITVTEEQKGQNYDQDSFELPLPKRMSTSPVGSTNASYASIDSTSSQHTAASSTASASGAAGRKRKSTSTTLTKKPDKKPKPEIKPETKPVIKAEKGSSTKTTSKSETHADRRERLMSSLYEGCSLFIRVSASAKEPYAAKVVEVYPDTKQIRVRWESRGDEEVVEVDPDTMEHFDSLQPRSRRGN